jgi:hypothetical protein
MPLDMKLMKDMKTIRLGGAGQSCRRADPPPRAAAGAMTDRGSHEPRIARVRLV